MVWRGTCVVQSYGDEIRRYGTDGSKSGSGRSHGGRSGGISDVQMGTGAVKKRKCGGEKCVGAEEIENLRDYGVTGPKCGQVNVEKRNDLAGVVGKEESACGVGATETGGDDEKLERRWWPERGRRKSPSCAGNDMSGVDGHEAGLQSGPGGWMSEVAGEIRPHDRGADCGVHAVDEYGGYPGGHWAERPWLIIWSGEPHVYVEELAAGRWRPE